MKWWNLGFESWLSKLSDSGQIDSIVDPASGEILHMIFRPNMAGDRDEGVVRKDISSEKEFLQASLISIPSSFTFRPHIHLERFKEFPKYKAQESWVVIGGRVEVQYYSRSGEALRTAVLEPGDLSITFHGGHGYKTLDDSALVYEFKTGPYEGQEVDKRFLN